MKVPPSRVLSVDGLVGIGDVSQIISDSAATADAAAPKGGHTGLLFPPFKERMPERLTRDYGNDIFAAIRAKDMVVHHPFESFNVRRRRRRGGAGAHGPHLHHLPSPLPRRCCSSCAPRRTTPP